MSPHALTSQLRHGSQSVRLTRHTHSPSENPEIGLNVRFPIGHRASQFPFLYFHSSSPAAAAAAAAGEEEEAGVLLLLPY